VRAELEESASLSVPRDRDGAEAEAVCELHPKIGRGRRYPGW
jgi:hypothetical protein